MYVVCMMQKELFVNDAIKISNSDTNGNCKKVVIDHIDFLKLVAYW